MNTNIALPNVFDTNDPSNQEYSNNNIPQTMYYDVVRNSDPVNQEMEENATHILNKQYIPDVPFIESLSKMWLIFSIFCLLAFVATGIVELIDTKNLHYVKGTIVTPCNDPSNASNAVMCKASISYSVDGKSYTYQPDLHVGDYNVNESVYVVYKDDVTKPIYIISSNVAQPYLGYIILSMAIAQLLFAIIAYYFGKNNNYMWCGINMFLSMVCLGVSIACIVLWAIRRH